MGNYIYTFDLWVFDFQTFTESFNSKPKPNLQKSEAMDSDKLSDYERIRLENIQRNNAFLASLGLDSVQPPKKTEHSSGTKQKKQEEKASRQKKRSRELEQEQKSQSSKTLRSSARLQAAVAKTEDSKATSGNDEEIEIEEEKDNNAIDYATMPIGPEDLDDEEFQLFIELRKWRLSKARALDIEPYKIFQNRVLAEAIRRRRQDANWGNVSDRDQLTDCWGIAEGKMNSGVAVELAEQMETPEALKWLTNSRLLSTCSQES